MQVDDSESDGLISRAAQRDSDALSKLFSKYSSRLKRMVRLRLSRHLQGRVDESDVLQEAYVDVSRKIDEYFTSPNVPFYLWLRHLTGLKLAEIHRRHLATQMRDAHREMSLYRGPLPEADTASLAAQLLGSFTSPSQAAIKAERRIRLQEVLSNLDATDREVLALRHFEQLSNEETAQVLGLSKSGATARHARALQRLRKALEKTPGFFE